MSRTYCLACTECKIALWVGQASVGGRFIYTGEPKTMDLLDKFLWEHESHLLVFKEDQLLGDDYKEIKYFKTEEVNNDTK